MDSFNRLIKGLYANDDTASHILITVYANTQTLANKSNITLTTLLVKLGIRHIFTNPISKNHKVIDEYNWTILQRKTDIYQDCLYAIKKEGNDDMTAITFFVDKSLTVKYNVGLHYNGDQFFSKMGLSAFIKYCASNSLSIYDIESKENGFLNNLYLTNQKSIF